MATLTNSTKRALEMASRAVSRESPRFVDLLRGNIQLATAIATELALMKSTWALNMGSRSASALPGAAAAIDQEIAAIQPEDLVTWLRVNREMVERICLELAEISSQWNSGIAFGAIGPLTAKGSLITHNGVAHDILSVDTNGRTLIANSAKTEGIEWVPRGERHFTLLAAGAGLVV